MRVRVKGPILPVSPIVRWIIKCNAMLKGNAIISVHLIITTQYKKKFEFVNAVAYSEGGGAIRKGGKVEVITAKIG